jgi:hypothetical protein
VAISKLLIDVEDDCDDHDSAATDASLCLSISMISNTPPSLRQYPELSADGFLQHESRNDEQQQEIDLTEEELRQLYDQEEIERFLRLFSTVCRFIQNH